MEEWKEKGAKTVGKQIRKGEKRDNWGISEHVRRQEIHYTKISGKRQHNERREHFCSPLSLLSDNVRGTRH